jgi:hypothetical protein
MSELISDEYKQTIAQMHAQDKTWGAARPQWSDMINKVIAGFEPHSILDYGCGKGWLKHELMTTGSIREYDPAFPSKAGNPLPAEFVTCVDVLEHIEPDRIDSVLNHIKSKMLVSGFFNIVLNESRKQILPDGRNPHILVKSRDWWIEKLSNYFDVVVHPGRGRDEHELVVKVYRKTEPIFIAAPPRSGTSMIAKLLNENGVFVGKCIEADRNNQFGYFENKAIVELNKKLLKENGHSGKSEPPELSTIDCTFDLRAKVLQSLIAEGYQEGPWLFKDSKILFTAEIWRKHFPQAKWVLPIRPINKIVESMGRHATWIRRGNTEYHHECASFMRMLQNKLSENDAFNSLLISSNEVAKGNAHDFEEFITISPISISRAIQQEAFHA